MAEIQFSNKAIEDLSDIWNYTYDTWSEKQADFYYNMLIGLCYEVADKPSIGRSYAIVSEGLYGIVAGNHIINLLSLFKAWNIFLCLYCIQ